MTATLTRRNITTKRGAPEATGHKYVTIADGLRRQIAAGVLAPGDRLPSFVQMRAQCGATPATMERVYGLLERDGLIDRLPGSGIYVAQPRHTATGVIGVIGDIMEEGPRGLGYWSLLLRGVRGAARDAELEILLLRQNSAIHPEKMDGVILCGCLPSELPQLALHPMPVVTLLRPVDDYCSVAADDYAGAYQATRHLLELGHRRIAYLTQEYDPWSQRRLAGYREALRENGIEPQANWVRMLDAEAPDKPDFVDKGHFTMRQWLREGWKKLGCTAVLAHNDETAMAVIEELCAAGLRVPQDVSVVGFDGLPAAEYFRPRLTTIEVPLEQIGAQGVKMLLAQMQDKTTKPSTQVLPVRLKNGDSTASPKKLKS